MSAQNPKNEPKKKRRTPAEIAQFAVDSPPMPGLAAVKPVKRAKVGKKVVVRLIERVKRL